MTLTYDAVREQPQPWAIPDVLPIGQLTLLAGTAGVGKGTWLADITARLTRGAMLPGGITMPAGRVVIVGPEDDPATAVKPRLVAAAADSSKVVDITYTDDSHPFTLGGPECDLPALRAMVKQLGDVRLVILDPVSAIAGCSLNVSRTVRRQIMEPLSRLARDLNVAVVLVHHFNKTGKQLAGSQAIVDAARLVLMINRDGDDIREVSVFKSNLAKDTVRPILYVIEGISPRAHVRYVAGHPPCRPQPGRNAGHDSVTSPARRR